MLMFFRFCTLEVENTLQGSPRNLIPVIIYPFKVLKRPNHMNGKFNIQFSLCTNSHSMYTFLFITFSVRIPARSVLRKVTQNIQTPYSKNFSDPLTFHNNFSSLEFSDALNLSKKLSFPKRENNPKNYSVFISYKNFAQIGYFWRFSSEKNIVCEMTYTGCVSTGACTLIK